MQWILHYQLFLFDFDGLLVNTEHLHFQAYLNMCAQRGYQLNWNFERFSEAAHHKPTDLQNQIYSEFPELQAEEPNWQILYREKQHHFLELVEKVGVSLLPGATDLLLALQKADIHRCVVTHSPSSLIKRIRQQNPILNTIPHWVTREDYTHPKPHPECYQIAIHKFAQPKDRIIGFEDSPRGLHALLETEAQPVLICPSNSSYLKKILQQHAQVHYYPTFNAITNQNAPLANDPVDNSP